MFVKENTEVRCQRCQHNAKGKIEIRLWITGIRRQRLVQIFKNIKSVQNMGQIRF